MSKFGMRLKKCFFKIYMRPQNEGLESVLSSKYMQQNKHLKSDVLRSQLL